MSWRQRLPENGLTYAALLEWAKGELQYARVPEPENDARLLLFHVFDMDLTTFLLRGRDQIPLTEGESRAEGLSRFLALLARRCRRVPLQHILGTAPFMGLSFRVSEDVLIPRADTEVLAETALGYLDDKSHARVLDLCTGSGALAVALKKYRPQIDCWAADLSEKALAIAVENAAANETPIRFFQGDLFDALPPGEGAAQGEGRTLFDLIVSNPPYIPTPVIETLAPEVKDHDPLLALDGGRDGLDLYRRIICRAPEHVKAGGRLCLEIGFDQGGAVRELLGAARFHSIRIRPDLAGLDRVAEAVWEG